MPQAERPQIIVPVATAENGDCYPLQSKATFVFEDGSRLVREQPYYRPAMDKYTGADGMPVFAGLEHQARAERLEFLSTLGGELAVAYADFFNESVQSRMYV